MTTFITRYLFILLVLLISSGCNSSTREESFDLEISFTHAEVLDEVIKELDKRNIKYKLEDESTLRYSSFNQGLVSNISNKKISEDLPSERSISVSNKFIQDQIESAFTEENIKFSVKVRHGENWVVWSKEDAQKGNSIANKIVMRQN